MYSMLDVLGCSRILWKFTRGAFSNAKTYINVINPTPTTLHYYWLLWRGIRAIGSSRWKTCRWSPRWFEPCVSYSKMGRVGEDVNCQTVTGLQKYCMKSLQSVFSLVLAPTKLAARGFLARISCSRLFYKFSSKRETVAVYGWRSHKKVCLGG